MQSDNPYNAPRSEATYLDPRIHAEVRLHYTLTKEDLRVATKRYFVDDPYLMLVFLGSFLVQGLFLAFLEEMYGYVPPAPVWMTVLLGFAAAYALRYLASIPIRVRIERNLRDSILGVGTKSVCFHPESVEVDNGEETIEFDLKDVTMRGSTKEHYLVVVLESCRILVVPPHAFEAQMYLNKFEKLMKKRLRSQRDFWSFKL